MLTKIKYMALFALAFVTRASELEKAELRAKISLSQFESIKNSINRTVDSVLNYRNKIQAQKEKNAQLIKTLEQENSRLKAVDSGLRDKVSDLTSKRSQVEKLAQ